MTRTAIGIAGGLLLSGILAAVTLNLPDRHIADWPSGYFNRAAICNTSVGGKIDLSTGCIQPGIGP